MRRRQSWASWPANTDEIGSLPPKVDPDNVVRRITPGAAAATKRQRTWRRRLILIVFATVVTLTFVVGYSIRTPSDKLETGVTTSQKSDATFQPMSDDPQHSSEQIGGDWKSLDEGYRKLKGN